MRILLVISTLLIAGMSSAQCYPDRHNTTWFDAWVSCEMTEAPNPLRGESHWIHYDMGYQYLLGEMEMWNVNDPQFLDRGVQEIFVDISEDGETWTDVGSFIVNQGNGTSIYEGAELMDFEGAQARYLLITVGTNYGAQFCSGFSEIRIGIEGVVSGLAESISPTACFQVVVYPNPHTYVFNAQVKTTCPDALSITLFDAMGRVIQEQKTHQVSESNVFELGEQDLPAGIYFLSVQQGDAIGRYQVVKSQ